MKITPLDRMLLFVTSLLAAYQVAVGLDRLEPFAEAAYTAAFGVLLVACLLLIILSLDVLGSPIVVAVATVIPLSLSLGLVAEHLPAYRSGYLVFTILGLLAVAATRTITSGRSAALVLAPVHGAAGLVILVLPLAAVLGGQAAGWFALVSLGGTLICLTGLLLTLLRLGRPILPQPTLLRMLPALLLLATAAFVAGFALR
jgi:hypothetical protein